MFLCGKVVSVCRKDQLVFSLFKRTSLDNFCVVLNLPFFREFSLGYTTEMALSVLVDDPVCLGTF